DIQRIDAPATNRPESNPEGRQL
ncbi:MAG: hypothetical protein RLZZ512_1721, partial [Bacteroidota bacterium]